MTTLLLVSLACAARPVGAEAVDLSTWTPQPAEWKGALVAGGHTTMTAEKWSFLHSPEDYAHAELSATVTIAETARQFRFVGEGWNAWPDPAYGDGGFEAALLLRAGKDAPDVAHHGGVLVGHPDNGGRVRG